MRYLNLNLLNTLILIETQIDILCASSVDF